MSTTNTSVAVAQAGVRTLPTLGGLWSWADRLLLGDWRLQQHAGSGVFRVLDGRSRCHATGDEATCRARLEQLRGQGLIVERPGPSVVLLHGILRTRHCMNPLARFLERQGFATYNVGYPAARWPMARHAESLRQIVEGLHDRGPVHLVGYSMGGLVIRRMLADGPLATPLGRCVFIGTPNRGAEKANPFVNWPLFRWLFGPAGLELSTVDGCGICSTLPPRPEQECGIIAGGTGQERGLLPVLPGDNDFTVTVESTHLPDEEAFRLVRCGHARLPMHRETLAATAAFLQSGRME